MMFVASPLAMCAGTPSLSSAFRSAVHGCGWPMYRAEPFGPIQYFQSFEPGP
jgi:hypothetical protein